MLIFIHARLADAISSWTLSQGLVESLEKFFEEKFASAISMEFTEHIEALRVLTSSWLTEVETGIF